MCIYMYNYVIDNLNTSIQLYSKLSHAFASVCWSVASSRLLDASLASLHRERAAMESAYMYFCSNASRVYANLAIDG
jgi:hypothetical protein